jgi:transcriptional regulator with XRE-family HTH domain
VVYVVAVVDASWVTGTGSSSTGRDGEASDVALIRRRLVQRRKAMGYTQESIAEKVQVDRSTIVRWERGETDPLPGLRIRIANALDLSLESLDALLHDTIADPIGHRRTGSDKDQQTNERALTFMEATRAADRQVGGGHLYATVASFLSEHPRPGSTRASREHAESHAAVASLSEMAGWMALESAAPAAAAEHLELASRYAADSGDDQLLAQTYASRSHLALQRGNAGAGVAFADTGLGQLRTGPGYGPLESRLLVMRARALATSGHPVEAACALAQAEQAFDQSGTPVSAWLSPYDSMSFAIDAARQFRTVGDLAETQRRLANVLAQAAPERVRSRTMAEMMLATARLGCSEIDDACALISTALGRMTALASAVLLAHLRHVLLLLDAHAQQHGQVGALIDEIIEATRARSWIGMTGPLRATRAGGIMA